MSRPLPTRREEAWRYADLSAVERLWPPPPPQRLALVPGEARTLALDVAPGIHDHVITLAPSARLDLRLLLAGESYTRVALDVTLEEGADFALGAAILAAGEAVLEVVATVRHAAPGATSRQTVRAIAAGRGVATCLPLIAVARGADGTDAAQSLKAVLLDRTAAANMKPELEIFADDVKAAHGCAIGGVDDAALFYLTARGIPPARARAMLLEAFLAAAFDGAGHAQPLAERARVALEALA